MTDTPGVVCGFCHGERCDWCDHLWCPECAGAARVRDPRTDTYSPCPACAVTAVSAP